LNTINEAALYSLIFRSRKPQAKKFRRWVTGTVLPAIRKTGRYDAHVNGQQPSVGAPKTKDIAYPGRGEYLLHVEGPGQYKLIKTTYGIEYLERRLIT
jgi:hypothetical protein